MSSDPRGGVHSPAGDRPTGDRPELSGATLVRARGATLLEALERHLPDSRDHADGTASYAFALAAELGSSRTDAEVVRETARLHEIGLVYVPASVLARPPEELGPEDLALVDSHASYGAELAKGAGVPDQACQWIAATRERFDGAGPNGLAGEQIPLQARIVRAACACDALLAMGSSSDGSRLDSSAIARLHAAAGEELDPRLVETLAGIVERASAPG
jgi:response regulator RpfG family c-di-GMP phosphodiesterase